MMLSLRLWIWSQQSLMQMFKGKKYLVCYFVLESNKKPRNMFQKHVDPLYIGSDYFFFIFFYIFFNSSELVNTDLKSKSSFLPLDFSDLLIVQ